MLVNRFAKLLAGVVVAAGLMTTVADIPASAQDAEAKAERRAKAKGPKLPRQPVARVASEQKRKDAINAWTLGLAAGRIEGAPLQFAAELARVVDDGENMRVLPMVTRGIFDNVFDLLHLRGVDAAIVYGDVLEHFKRSPELAGSLRRINYLLSLFPSELHIFVRPEINSLADLAGKSINFNTPGTAAAYSGPIIFKQLGIDIDAQFIPHNVAMAQLRKGEKFSALVFVSSKPLAPFLKGGFPPGFKFLPVPYTDKLEYYLPAYLESKDYPALIPEGQRIETIAVPAVLAVYDWPRNTDRYRRVARFVDYIYDRFGRLQKEPGYHPKWKDVNLAAKVPGWQRFQAMQDKLDQVTAQRPAPAAGPARTAVDQGLARAQAARAAPNDAREQERLFQQFLEWSRKQQN